MSECVNTFPKYFMKRDKWPVTEDLKNVSIKLKKHFNNAKINELDGIRLDFKDSSWFHLRPSITEPIVRLFCEAKEEKRMEALFNEVKLTLSL